MVTLLIKRITSTSRVIQRITSWVAVAVSAIVFSSNTAMPTHAINEVVGCSRVKDGLLIAPPAVKEGYFEVFAGQSISRTMCFANAGEQSVNIPDVHKFSSGNNAGYVETNKIKVTFNKNTGYDFIKSGPGAVTITRIVIY